MSVKCIPTILDTFFVLDRVIDILVRAVNLRYNEIQGCGNAFFEPKV